MSWLTTESEGLSNSIEGYGNIRVLFHVYENHRGQTTLAKKPKFDAAMTPETSC